MRTGAGKTSLALEVARRVEATMPDGAALIDLTAVREADALALTCCDALGLVDQGAAPISVLIAHLAPRQQLTVLTPPEVAERLSRLVGIDGRTRSRAARQRTMDATIDWSHDLLDEREQALFRRLAVFGGGWTLAAAEHVGSLGKGDPTVAAILISLVEQSLVVREGHVRPAGSACSPRSPSTPDASSQHPTSSRPPHWPTPTTTSPPSVRAHRTRGRSNPSNST